MLSNELFYSYVDDTEKEFMAIESEFDIEMDKANLALEYADRLYEIKLKQSDLKVLNESGTHEDISFLYEAASKEAGEKKKNIISRMFEAIAKFVESIVAKIKKIFTKEKSQELDKAIQDGSVTEIKCSKDPKKMLQAAEDAMKKMAQFLKPGFHVTDETGQKIFSIQKTLVTATEAVGAGVISAKLAKPYIDKMEKHLETLKAQSKTYQDWLTNYESLKMSGMSDEEAEQYANEQTGCTKAVAEFMQKETKVLNTSIGDIITGINNALSSAKSAVNDTIAKGKNAVNNTIEKGKTAAAVSKTARDLKKSNTPGVTDYKKAAKEIHGVNESADDSFLENKELEETCDDIMSMLDNM